MKQPPFKIPQGVFFFKKTGAGIKMTRSEIATKTKSCELIFRLGGWR